MPLKSLPLVVAIYVDRRARTNAERPFVATSPAYIDRARDDGNIGHNTRRATRDCMDTAPEP